MVNPLRADPMVCFPRLTPDPKGNEGAEFLPDCTNAGRDLLDSCKQERATPERGGQLLGWDPILATCPLATPNAGPTAQPPRPNQGGPGPTTHLQGLQLFSLTSQHQERNCLSEDQTRPFPVGCSLHSALSLRPLPAYPSPRQEAAL